VAAYSVVLLFGEAVRSSGVRARQQCNNNKCTMADKQYHEQKNNSTASSQ
jgi:hypothetical protein